MLPPSAVPATANAPLHVPSRHAKTRSTVLDEWRATPRGRWGALAGWIVLCAGGGAVIGVLTAGGTSPWYLGLDKPSWTPPSWLFAPVWTTLYVLMGVAAWRIWRLDDARRGGALGLFMAQLALNFSWSPLFFTGQRPGYALVDIVGLWSLVLLTIVAFTRMDRLAARLLWPYLAWVTFASLLNGAIVAMN